MHHNHLNMEDNAGDVNSLQIIVTKFFKQICWNLTSAHDNEAVMENKKHKVLHNY